MSGASVLLYGDQSSISGIKKFVGNIGIGIGAHTSVGKLHVSGGDMLLANSNYLQFCQKTSANGGAAFLRAATDDSFTMHTSSYSTPIKIDGSTVLLNTLSNGNVGVGTASPASKFHVVGTGGSLRMQDSIANAKYIQLRSDVNNSYLEHIGGPADALRINNQAAGQIEFLTNNTERLRIDSIGNVGIGTASPAVGLHLKSINETLRLETTAATGRNYLAFYKSGAIRQGYFGYGSTANDFLTLSNEIAGAGMQFNIGGAFAMALDSGGNLGIGNTAVGRLYATQGTSPNTASLIIGYLNTSANYFDANNQIFRNGSGVESMRISASGYLGIGTTTPSTPLVVGVGTNSVNIGVLDTYPTIFGWNGTTNSAHKSLSIRATTAIQLFLSTGGNVGIGTASPDHSLDTTGNIRTRLGYIYGTTTGQGFVNINSNGLHVNNPSNDGGNNIRLGSANNQYGLYRSGDMSIQTDGSNNLILSTIGAGPIILKTTNTERVRINSSGVGIGITPPTTDPHPLTVFDSTNGGIRLQNSTNFSSIAQNGGDVFFDIGRGGTAGILIFRRGSALSESLRINSIGNVGIGVTSPSEKLEVAGNILANNLVYNTGNQTISGVKTFLNSGIFSSGLVPAVALLNNPLSVVGSGNSYVQFNIQNRATGTNASADLVITANNGTDNSNFINLGINNNGYNDPAFSNGTGLDGYLFIDGGNLDIGTKTPGRAIEFHAGGTVAGSTIARITESGLNVVSGNLTVNNTGVLLSGQNSFILTLSHASDSSLNVGNNYFGNIFGAGTSSSLALRKFIIMENCIARKFTWSNFVGTQGTATQNATGYFINVTRNTTGTLTTGITNNSSNTQQNISGYFSSPMLLREGDEVVASLGIISGGTGPITTAVRNNVNIYCYN